MIIKIDSNAVETSDLKSLNFLFHLLTYKLRYNLFLELEEISQTNFYKTLDYDDSILIQQSYDKIILEGQDPNFIIDENVTGRQYFNIADAIRFFIQPVSIILENSLNDQYFIKSIFKYFDSERKIIDHVENGWIQFENAGGCMNVENFIEGKLQSYNNYSNKERFVRAVVVLDSDRNFPSDAIPEKYAKLVQYLNDVGVEYHILEKRTMQNYLPDEVIDDIGTNQAYSAWCNVYRYLSDEQKDYLDYREGFSRKDGQGNSVVLRTDLPEGIRDLYNGLSTANYNILDRGLAMPSFKSNFPRYFEHHQVHRQSLQNRLGQNDEFVRILEMVNKKI